MTTETITTDKPHAFHSDGPNVPPHMMTMRDAWGHEKTFPMPGQFFGHTHRRSKAFVRGINCVQKGCEGKWPHQRYFIHWVEYEGYLYYP